MTTTTERRLRPEEQANIDAGRRFLSDTEGFTLKVLHDDGLYKHLHFRGGGPFYWFDLVTWPGHLTFRGDAGCFTFARTEDMLAFFRQGNAGRSYDDPHRINASYWGEKVQGTIDNGRPAVKKYDKDELLRWMREQATEHAETEGWPETIREGLLQAIKDWADWDLWDDRVHDVEEARSFKFELAEGDAPVRPGDPAQKTWEWSPHDDHLIEADFTAYDWSFLWACHAILWGIEQYDEHRAQAAAAAIRERADAFTAAELGQEVSE